jgi:hypothetical protein
MDFREFEVIVFYADIESSLNVINALLKVITGSELGEWIMWGFESYCIIKGFG